MKNKFYIVMMLLCFKFNYLIASSDKLIRFEESVNTVYSFNKNNSTANSDLSVVLTSLNENVQSCGPEQKFKIVLTNNSSQDSKSINGMLFDLNLPSSYALTNTVIVKIGGVVLASNSLIQNGNSINISSNYTLNPSSSLEVIFGATISCNFNLSESISLVTYYNNELNQTLIANNNINSQFNVNYSRSDYQVINFTKNQLIDRFVEIERSIKFKDLNYQMGNRVNKLKLTYTYPVANVQLIKLKVKKLDGTYFEIPYDYKTNTPLTNQGDIKYTTSSFLIDANLLNAEFISETVEMQLVYKYIGCSSSNVIYDLKQYCANGDVCSFKSNLANVNENITLNSGLPTFDVSYIQEKSKKADNCDRTGKYRYSITNTSNQNLSAYNFSPNFGNMRNIKNVDIYYVYTDNLGNEQYHKWNGNLATDLDGSGVGLDLMVDPTSNTNISFLAPGKTIQVEYRYELVDLCSSSDLSLTYQVQFWTYFYNICGTASTYPLNYFYRSTESITNRSISGPSDVVENTITSFFYTPGYSVSSESGLMESCDSRNYEVKFKIPGTATIENVKYNNLVIGTTNWYITTESGVRYLTITHPTSNVGNDGTYEIQLMSGDCSTATSQNLEFELFTYCGTETCRRSLCKVSKLTYFHSNQCGNTGCFNTNSFSFKRSTFGWKVNRSVTDNMYYASDLAVRATENDGVDTSKVYADDYIKYHLKGIASSKCGENLVAKLKYTSNTSLFDVSSGQFLIKNATTGTILYTLNVNSSQITFGVEGMYQTILFNVPLTNISSLSNVILDFQSDLHVKVSVPTGKYILEDVRGEFLFKNQDFIYGKDSWGKRFTVLSEVNQYYSNTSYSLESCKNKVVFGVEAVSSNIYGEVDFTNEFRPVSHFIDEQTITIPVDFDYVPHSIKLGIVNQNDMIDFRTQDKIKYYPTDKYSVIENYDPISKILKIKINNSPLLLNDNKSILVCVFDIKSMNCYSNIEWNNEMLINYSRRDYAYVNNTSIEPELNYKQSASPDYMSYLGKINFGFDSRNNYSKPYNKEKVSWDYSDYIRLYNYSGRPLGNFWIAFENNLPVKLKFSNVKIDQNVGTISNYGENDKYTIVNFGDLPYSTYISKFLTFDVATDECSSIPSDMFNLPFKMFMGTSCSSKQYSRPNTGCQLLPIDFNLEIKNDGTELNKMVIANSDYEPLNTISPSKICDKIYYVATISNSSTSTSVFENEANVIFPTGMELTSVKYRYGSGQITPIDYEVISPNEISINLSANISDITQGFKSNGGVNNPIDLMFDFKTNCQFSPSENTVELNYSYKKYCGESVSLSNNDANLKIEGFENLNNMKLSLLSSNSLPITKLSGDGKVSITVKNSGNISSESSVLSITLPKELKFVNSEQGTLTSNTSNLLNYSIPQLPSGELSSVKFLINDQYGNKAMEGIRPSVCISEELKITKSLVTSCLNSCNITATLAKDRICIPLPPKDSIPEEVHCEDCIESFAPYQSAKYVLSAWVREDVVQNGLTSYSGPAVVLRFKLQENELALNPMIASGEIIDGWQRIYQEFIIPSDAQNISVDLINTGNNEVFFDDIRIHPFEANMKSFVYDPVSMKLVAELDENNYATFYEYDEEGALVRVKKETERGVMTIKESRNNTIKK